MYKSLEEGHTTPPLQGTGTDLTTLSSQCWFARLARRGGEGGREQEKDIFDLVAKCPN